MPENIRRHTMVVTAVADAVAVHLTRRGLTVNAELVNRGALLHDIAKIITLKTPQERHHTLVGARIVKEEGYAKELAAIVEKHGLNSFSSALTLEEQIVNYADKRAKHDTLVSLKDRMDDLAVRYSHAQKIIEKTMPLFAEFEKKYGLEHVAITL